MARKRGPGRPRKKRGPGRTTPDVTYEERVMIKALLSAGHTHAEIGRIINRSRSCISREVRRGQCEQETSLDVRVMRYEPDYAEMKHREAQSRKGPSLKIDKDHLTAAALEFYIVEKRYSPHAAIMKSASTGEMRTRISLSTLYEYIHKEVIAVKEHHLRYGFNPRKRKNSDESFESRSDSARRRGGESIAARPKSVLRRKEFGHWEGDLVVSGRGSPSAVLTLVERKTRWLFSVKLDSKRQSSVVAALDQLELRLGRVFKLIFRSVTFDNGLEFMDTDGMQRCGLHDPGGEKRIAKVYYAHPYCSSERGSNENINRMLRLAFPKGTDFDTVSDEDLQRHVSWINEYPRAILGGRCASECFSTEVGRLLAS